MSYLPKQYKYMPSGSYLLVPPGMYEDRIAKREPDTYARLSDGTVVVFLKPVSAELRERFIEEYEERLKNPDPLEFI